MRIETLDIAIQDKMVFRLLVFAFITCLGNEIVETIDGYYRGGARPEFLLNPPKMACMNPPGIHESLLNPS